MNLRIAIIPILAFFCCADVLCQSDLYSEINRNKIDLPENFKLSKKVSKVVDSTFNYRAGNRILVYVTEYKAGKGVFKSSDWQIFNEEGKVAGSAVKVFDRNGNTIEETFKGAETRKIITRYDSLGNKRMMTFETDGLVHNYYFVNTYDKNSRLVKTIWIDHKKDTLGVDNYVYNAIGKLEKHFGTKRGVLKHFPTTTFKLYFYYDDKNRLISRQDNHSDSNKITHTYEYKDGLLVKDVILELGRSSTDTIRNREYSYDNKGQLVSCIDLGLEDHYAAYDANGNWREKKQLNKGQSSQEIKRTVFYSR